MCEEGRKTDRHTLRYLHAAPAAHFIRRKLLFKRPTPQPQATTHGTHREEHKNEHIQPQHMASAETDIQTNTYSHNDTDFIKQT